MKRIWMYGIGGLLVLMLAGMALAASPWPTQDTDVVVNSTPINWTWLGDQAMNAVPAYGTSQSGIALYAPNDSTPAGNVQVNEQSDETGTHVTVTLDAALPYLLDEPGQSYNIWLVNSKTGEKTLFGPYDGSGTFWQELSFGGNTFPGFNRVAVTKGDENGLGTQLTMLTGSV